MFVTIEWGENKSLVINPDCMAVVFIDCIKKTCGLSKSTIIDLCDETATLFEMYNKDPMENIFDYFLPRSAFLLVSVQRNVDGSVGKITPLMDEYEKKYPFLERKLRARDKRAKQATIPEIKSPPNDSKLSLANKKVEKSSKNLSTPPESRRESNVIDAPKVSKKKSFNRNRK